jgi:hypothetical protein
VLRRFFLNLLAAMKCSFTKFDDGKFLDLVFGFGYYALY